VELGRKRRDKDGEEFRLPSEGQARGTAFGWFLLQALHEAERRSAVLVLLPPEDERATGSRLVAETCRLDHPHLARVHAAGVAHGVAFQIVEDFRGSRSLASLVEGRGPAHWQEALVLGGALASGLDAVHSAGLVHGAISPDAIHLDARFSPKLGLDARALAFAGDPGRGPPHPYRAPEDSDHLTSVRGNLYSLGAVLYVLLTGRPPVDGPPPPRELEPEVPERLERLVLDLLERDPAGRPASASEVVARLGALG
jgi:serine/threonine protein kinase